MCFHIEYPVISWFLHIGEKEENFKLGAEKFYEETRTVSKFNGYENVIKVYEFFYENNTAYFVMEYIGLPKQIPEAAMILIKHNFNERWDL
ncbi:MAG: hypothetical protein ACYDG2_15985 [Ruminiclostridium sp.]